MKRAILVLPKVLFFSFFCFKILISIFKVLIVAIYISFIDSTSNSLINLFKKTL